jgi:hypothetical protein
MGGPRVKRLRENVCTALRVADEYVWVYGEKFRWWPTPNKRVNEQTWPEALPGSELALAFARDPIAYARTQIAELSKAGKLVNLARNGDFGSDKAESEEGAPEDWKKDGAPAGWHVWQDKDSKGRFTWDRENGAAGKGSAQAANVNNGCFIQSSKVKPGEGYVIQAVRRLQGKGDARIRVRWQTEDGKWTAEALDRIFGSDGPRDQWSEIIGVVQVPEDAGKLAILLGVAGQTSPDDVAWYDDVRLYRIE